MSCQKVGLDEDIHDLITRQNLLPTSKTHWPTLPIIMLTLSKLLTFKLPYLTPEGKLLCIKLLTTDDKALA